MALVRCEFSKNNLESFKHVWIPVGGFNVEANGTAVSYPNNIKNVFPDCYKKMSANDFSVSTSLGSGVYVNKQTQQNTGYTRTSASNINYNADTGTLTATVSISRANSSIEQVFQMAYARWNGTVGGSKV